MKIYYAHPLSTYGSSQECRDLATIIRLFPEAEIINPNSETHQEGYGKMGMQYFFDLVATCGAIVFRAFPDGTIPAGIAGEIKAAKDGTPIIELPTAITGRTLSIDRTREFLRECGFR